MSGFTRSAPIAIAPKPAARVSTPSSFAGPAHRRQEGYPNFDICRGSMPSFDLPESDSFPGSPSPRCVACQHRRTKCSITEDEDACLSCQVNGTDCSLVASPQQRKRKINGDASRDISSKRRLVFDTYRPRLTRDTRTHLIRGRICTYIHPPQSTLIPFSHLHIPFIDA
jgi:hypothetical protein